MIESTYNISKSYQWNYDNGPVFTDKIPFNLPVKSIKLWGYDISSPLGVPAGPLLNANFVELYAKLGFDIPVYKTIRTVEREAHPRPNCLFVDPNKQLAISDIGNRIFPLKDTKSGNDEITNIAITNSFGVPSKSIEIWQADIEKANKNLAPNQLMIVSCVGTPLQSRSIIEDYALCARLAVEAGAKAIELNYSCPNVQSKEGSIYQDAELSSTISKAVKTAIGGVPLMIKMGYIKDELSLNQIITKNAKYIDGIAAINTIPMQVVKHDGTQALPGEGRLKSGICGNIIKNISLAMVERIVNIKIRNKYDFIVCGVGGITDHKDFDDYFSIGADIAMSATGAMWNPYLARDWRESNHKA